MAASTGTASTDATPLFCCSMSSATLVKSSLVRKVGNGSRHLDCCRNATQCFFLVDVISYSSAIIACEKGRKWKHAFGLLVRIYSPFFYCQRSSARILPSAPVRKVGNGGKHRDCVYGCDTIILLLDVISYTSEIVTSEKGGQWQPAPGLLQRCDTMFFFW